MSLVFAAALQLVSVLPPAELKRAVPPKESIVVDIKQEADRALIKRILAKADVWVQNLAPGATERAGFGSKQLREAT